MKTAFIVLFLGVTLSAQAGACPEEAGWRARVLEQINALRASGGVCTGEGSFGPGAPMSWNSTLETVAVVHSRWMAERGELLHVGRRGEGLGERARQADYVYERLGENVAMGFHQLEQVVEAWRQSAKHCVNMLDPRFTEVGLACVRSANGPWWTLTFGRPNTRTQTAQATRVSFGSR